MINITNRLNMLFNAIFLSNILYLLSSSMGSICQGEKPTIPRSDYIMNNYNQSQNNRKKRSSASFRSRRQNQGRSELFKNIEDKINTLDSKGHLFQMIYQLFFDKYQKSQLEIVQKLLQHWIKNQELQNLLNHEFATLKYHHYYKNCEILSARVYQKIILWFKDLQSKRIKDNEEYLSFQSYIKKNRFDFSYDKNLFIKPSERKSRLFIYSCFNDEQTYADKKQNSEYLLQVQEHKYFNSQFIQKLHLFMKDIHLVHHKNMNMNNIFAANLQRITSEDQKLMYIKDMNIPYLDQLIEHYQLSSKGKVDQQDHDKIIKIIRKNNPNYWYYYGNCKKNIDILHQKYKDYEFLQQRHDYIQLMFPNHYGSSFNSQARPLNYLEKYIFLQNQQIGFKVLESIYIFFDFMGISMSLQQNPIKLRLSSQKRLKNVLIHNTHNHLRIMRILACLSVIGFRSIALSLIQFLKMVTQKAQFKTVRREFEKNWNIYGNQNENKPKPKAKEMCFLQTQDFPENHTILSKIQGYFHNNSSFSMKKDEILTQNKPIKQHYNEQISLQQYNQIYFDQKYIKSLIDEQNNKQIYRNNQNNKLIIFGKKNSDGQKQKFTSQSKFLRQNNKIYKDN